MTANALLAAQSGTDSAGGKMPVESRMQVILGGHEQCRLERRRGDAALLGRSKAVASPVRVGFWAGASRVIGLGIPGGALRDVLVTVRLRHRRAPPVATGNA